MSTPRLLADSYKPQVEQMAARVAAESRRLWSVMVARLEEAEAAERRRWRRAAFEEKDARAELGLMISANVEARTLLYKYSAPTLDPRDMAKMKLANPDPLRGAVEKRPVISRR